MTKRITLTELSKVGVNYEGETPNELAKKAGLDWKAVTALSTYVVNNKSYESTRTRIITREDKPEIELGRCGTKWEPLQNEVILETMIEFCKLGSGLKLSRVGYFKEGKTIWALAHTDNCFELRGGDKVSGNILLINSHEFGRGMQAKVLLDREICTNQLVLGLSNKTQVYKHNKTLDSTKVLGILSSFHKQFKKTKEEAEILSITKLDLDVFYRLVIKEFGIIDKMNHQDATLTDLSEQPKTVRQIIKLYQGEGMGSEMLSSFNTFWGGVNAITQQINHHSKMVGGIEGHINSLWLESKANKQQKIYKQMVTLAGL